MSVVESILSSPVYNPSSSDDNKKNMKKTTQDQNTATSSKNKETDTFYNDLVKEVMRTKNVTEKVAKAEVDALY